MAQSPSISYPSARRADVIDDYFGSKVADPYRWMEDLSSPELKRWVDAQNALTFGYLNGLPQRDALKARITELWNYSKVSPPHYAGGHWFYHGNTGLQRQSVVFMRETLNGPATVVLDPNSLSPDGSMALSAFIPAPGGRHFAYGQSQGGSDWSTFYVRELGTGRELRDVIRWVRSPSVAWTENGSGFFYGRYPEPRPGKGHSFKFAATLQVAQGCDRPVLIRIETQASHAYRPTDKGIAELADVWAFALAHMRVRPPDTALAAARQHR